MPKNAKLSIILDILIVNDFADYFADIELLAVATQNSKH